MSLLSERHGLCITEDVAREDISDHVDLVAERMRISRRAAKYYITDDVIEGLADHIADVVCKAKSEPDQPPLRGIP